jgi:ubiquinone/menaquinone biosynthesis C-methylase UbiE
MLETKDQTERDNIKGRHDSPINGLMAGWYARLTGRDLGEFCRLADRIAAQLAPGSDVLEVAPGPGYWAIELAKRGDFRITGLDLSADFVRMADKNAAAAGVRIDFYHGNAAAMPLESDAFDFLLCRAAFKNFADPVGALNEMHRVLRAGGRALVIDLRRDASIADVNIAVSNMKLGRVNATITRFIFRHSLLKRAYSRQDFERLAGESRFGSCQIQTDAIGLEVTLEKQSG